MRQDNLEQEKLAGVARALSALTSNKASSVASNTLNQSKKHGPVGRAFKKLRATHARSGYRRGVEGRHPSLGAGLTRFGPANLVTGAERKANTVGRNIKESGGKVKPVRTGDRAVDIGIRREQMDIKKNPGLVKKRSEMRQALSKAKDGVASTVSAATNPVDAAHTVTSKKLTKFKDRALKGGKSFRVPSAQKVL